MYINSRISIIERSQLDRFLISISAQNHLVSISSSKVVIGWTAYMIEQGKMQHSHQPPSPVGQAMQPCLWPLTMLEAALEVATEVEVEPGMIVFSGSFASFRVWEFSNLS
jgi:hypothetical protein